MESIWKVIEDQTLGSWRKYCIAIDKQEESEAIIQTHLSELSALGQTGMERLNQLVCYCGYDNSRAAETLALTGKYQLLQVLTDNNVPFRPELDDERLILLQQLDDAQRKLLDYARQWNQTLEPTGGERTFGRRLWSGAKVHIEEGPLAYRDNGSRVWITLPAPFAAHASRLYMGIWDAAAELTDFRNKYEYIGRPAEAVGALINSSQPLLDKSLYECLLGGAYDVLYRWQYRLMSEIKLTHPQHETGDLFSARPLMF